VWLCCGGCSLARVQVVDGANRKMLNESGGAGAPEKLEIAGGATVAADFGRTTPGMSDWEVTIKVRLLVLVFCACFVHASLQRAVCVFCSVYARVCVALWSVCVFCSVYAWLCVTFYASPYRGLASCAACVYASIVRIDGAACSPLVYLCTCLCVRPCVRMRVYMHARMHACICRCTHFRPHTHALFRSCARTLDPLWQHARALLCDNGCSFCMKIECVLLQ
jgi:hypothetical protein